MSFIDEPKLSVFNYDEIPAGYYYHVMINGRPPQRFWHREKFNEIISRIQNGERVLDYGCGPGAFLSLLAEQRPDVSAVGVDIGSRQIDFAEKTFGKNYPKSRLCFHKVEAGKVTLPFESHSFDTVTSIEVIEHLHPELALKSLLEAKRLLKVGGRLQVTTPNYLSLWPLLEMMLERFSPVKYHDQHINRFTRRSLVKFIEKAGFKVESIKTIFIVAPFFAQISQAGAQVLHRVEKLCPFHWGSLLVVEAVPKIPK